MTPKTRETNRLARRALLVVTGVVAGSLLLAGCVTAPTDDPTTSSTPPASSTPTPTPTPTPTKASAPTSDSEAVAAAEEVIGRFYETRVAVNTAGGADPSPLAQVAFGPALTIVTNDANRLAAAGKFASGEITFTPSSAYSGDLADSAGNVFPFSSVQVTGCQDGTTYELKLADGTPTEQPEQRKNELQITVIFDPTESMWLVENLVATGAAC